MEVQRISAIALKKKLRQSPAVVILGPRQVGKTTLALQISKSSERPFLYLDMESLRDVAKFGDDPETFFEYHQDKLIILDEIQAQPHLFAVLRGVIDRNRKSGQFLLLGSASPKLVSGVSESLAGRVSYLDLPPFMFEEIKHLKSLEHHWFRGGFPIAFLAESDDDFLEWMESFIRTYVQSDLSNLFGYNLNPAITGKLWVMIANLHANLLNIQDLARSIGVTAPVINRYLNLLEAAFLVHQLRPWHTNISKRLVKSSKIYIKDSGILHTLLSINSFDELTLHPIIGASWEGYVIEQIAYHKPPSLDMFFYRTHAGTEIDLVLVKANKPIASIEIKYSNVPKPSRGFFNGIEDLKTNQNFIITPASDQFPYHNATVCNLQTFLLAHLPKIK